MTLTNFALISKALSNPTWDVVLILTILAIGFFYGLYRGKKRLAAMIIYTYAAIAISSALPAEKWLGFLGETNLYMLRAGLFLLVFVLLGLFLGSKKTKGFSSGGPWWQIFLLSFTQVFFIAHVFLGFLPEDKIKTLAPFTKNILANPDYNLWWITGPILLVILLRRLDRSH